jgi:hypothetical protein
MRQINTAIRHLTGKLALSINHLSMIAAKVWQKLDEFAEVLHFPRHRAGFGGKRHDLHRYHPRRVYLLPDTGLPGGEGGGDLSG